MFQIYVFVHSEQYFNLEAFKIVEGENNRICDAIKDILSAFVAAKKIAKKTDKELKDIAAQLSAIIIQHRDYYIAARKEITSSFKPQNFLFDRILSRVASVDGVDYYYINDKLITPIAKKSEVNVNQGEMVEIAKKQLQLSFNDINASEFAN